MFTYEKVTDYKANHDTEIEIFEDHFTQLVEMLSYKRPHASSSEAEWIERFILPLAQLPQVDEMFSDFAGNIYAKIAGGSKTLFTAHTDTVHKDAGRQEVWVDVSNVAFVEPKEGCLGADNAVGVFLLTELIKAGKPCWIQFTRGEERGGIGSGDAAESYPDFFKQFDCAIAFDRKATKSIITHQMVGRTCSSEFGTALAELLGMGHELDPTGSFTDTANYAHLIPECTNVSAGYYNEHSSKETLDIDYVLELRGNLLAINWGDVTLPVSRDPSVVESRSWGFSRPTTTNSRFNPTAEDFASCTYEEIVEWVRSEDLHTVAYMIQTLADEAVGSSLYNYNTGFDDYSNSQFKE